MKKLQYSTMSINWKERKKIRHISDLKEFLVYGRFALLSSDPGAICFFLIIVLPVLNTNHMSFICCLVSEYSVLIANYSLAPYLMHVCTSNNITGRFTVFLLLYDCSSNITARLFISD
jgi:hypothetical protein